MIKLNDKMLAEFTTYLVERECSAATVAKYLHDIRELKKWSPAFWP